VHCFPDDGLKQNLSSNLRQDAVGGCRIEEEKSVHEVKFLMRGRGG
jgi:hypothetical protein